MLSRGFGNGGRSGLIHSPHVDVEQGLVLVTLVLILLAQLDDLLEDLHVEALTLGLGEDFLLGLVQVLDLVLDLLNALHERADPIARNSNDVTHGFSFAVCGPALSGRGVSTPLIWRSSRTGR